jgi:hypothetical protein
VFDRAPADVHAMVDAGEGLDALWARLAIRLGEDDELAAGFRRALSAHRGFSRAFYSLDTEAPPVDRIRLVLEQASHGIRDSAQSFNRAAVARVGARLPAELD